MYNGFPANLVKSGTGAEAESIELLAQGVVTRGVLLDIPRLRGMKWLMDPEPIFPEELEEAEKAQGVTVESGDVLTNPHGAFGAVLFWGTFGVR